MDLRHYKGKYLVPDAICKQDYDIIHIDESYYIEINIIETPSRRIGSDRYYLEIVPHEDGKIIRIRRGKENSWNGEMWTGNKPPNHRYPEDIQNMAEEILNSVTSYAPQGMSMSDFWESQESAKPSMRPSESKPSPQKSAKDYEKWLREWDINDTGVLLPEIIFTYKKCTETGLHVDEVIQMKLLDYILSDDDDPLLFRTGLIPIACQSIGLNPTPEIKNKLLQIRTRAQNEIYIAYLGHSQRDYLDGLYDKAITALDMVLEC